jgi:hypothetical protein
MTFIVVQLVIISQLFIMVVSVATVSNNAVFPGIYSLTITRGQLQLLSQIQPSSSSPPPSQQQQQQQHEQGKETAVATVTAVEPIWLHMDIIQVDCGVESDQCHVHTLIQSSNEYQFLQSKLLLIQEQQQQATPVSTSSLHLRYNATLSQQWIEPRLAIQRHYFPTHTNNNNNSTTTTTSSNPHLRTSPSPPPRFLNSDGYSHIADRDCLLDYQGMMDWIQDFIQQANATGLLQVKWKDIGDSYLKTMDPQQGNDIHVLTVTGRRHNHNHNNTNMTEAPPAFTAAPLVLMSSIHAREYAPPELVRRFLLHILQDVQETNRIPHYLEATEIHWIPYVNVDGRQLAETIEPFRRKNLNSDWNSASSFCSNDAYGVDLNRNFPFMWGAEGGSSIEACSPDARGSGPASEPETQAVIQYAIQLFPLAQQKQALAMQSSDDLTTTTTTSLSIPDNWNGYNETTTMGVFVDLHSFGQSKILKGLWGDGK